MNHNAQQLLDSLLSYHFSPSIGKPWSHVALFKEYARRMAWWADELQKTNDWLTTNIAYVLELDDNLDKEPLEKFDNYLKSQALYPPMPDLLRSALIFAMVSDNKEVKQFKLDSPYDPVVKLYTRGGYIRWNDRGFWEVSGAFGIGGMDIATYKVPTAFVALDDEELDFLDNDDSQTS